MAGGAEVLHRDEGRARALSPGVTPHRGLSPRGSPPAVGPPFILPPRALEGRVGPKGYPAHGRASRRKDLGLVVKEFPDLCTVLEGSRDSPRTWSVFGPLTCYQAGTPDFCRRDSRHRQMGSRVGGTSLTKPGPRERVRGSLKSSKLL